jgi:hypothetical protein
MNPLISRYRFLRRNGWNKTHARTAILILFTSQYQGKFAN